MKKDCPRRKGFVFLFLVLLQPRFLGVPAEALAPQSNAGLLPVIVEVAGVERLNDIAPKPPFKTTPWSSGEFRLSNPNPAGQSGGSYFESKWRTARRQNDRVDGSCREFHPPREK